MTPETLKAWVRAIGESAHCDSCGNQIASCVGEYDSQPPATACDACCGHGNEDGRCQPIPDVVATLLALLEAQTWQQIATAIKDGKDVWCYDRHDGYYAACLVDCTEFLGVGKGSHAAMRWHNKSANRWSEPTHWMPLPAAPVPSEDR
jgi:hypothetical protein